MFRHFLWIFCSLCQHGIAEQQKRRWRGHPYIMEAGVSCFIHSGLKLLGASHITPLSCLRWQSSEKSLYLSKSWFYRVGKTQRPPRAVWGRGDRFFWVKKIKTPEKISKSVLKGPQARNLKIFLIFCGKNSISAQGRCRGSFFSKKWKIKTKISNPALKGWRPET